jgi:hypothetical protein
VPEFTPILFNKSGFKRGLGRSPEPNSAKVVVNSQSYWPLMNHIPTEGGRVGRTLPIKDSLSVAERKGSLRYAQAFVSGIICIRPDKSLLEDNAVSNCFVRYGQGWYNLRLSNINKNPGLLRKIVSVCVRDPSRVLTIYGRSYISLVRRPSVCFLQRMAYAGDTIHSFVDRSRTLGYTLCSRRFEEALRHIVLSSDKVTSLISKLEWKSQLDWLAGKKPATAPELLRHSFSQSPICTK